jgi:hypothetical protein
MRSVADDEETLLARPGLRSHGLRLSPTACTSSGLGTCEGSQIRMKASALRQASAWVCMYGLMTSCAVLWPQIRHGITSFITVRAIIEPGAADDHPDNVCCAENLPVCSIAD